MFISLYRFPSKFAKLYIVPVIGTGLLAGYYANGSSAVCSKCSDRFVAYTSGAASASCDECIAGHYKHFTNRKVKCSICPEGTKCPVS